MKNVIYVNEERILHREVNINPEEGTKVFFISSLCLKENLSHVAMPQTFLESFCQEDFWLKMWWCSYTSTAKPLRNSSISANGSTAQRKNTTP